MPNDGEQPFAAVIAHLLVEDSPAELERLAGVVGMAVGTQPTSARFTEIDLRRMLERASGYREDVVEDRWVIETRHRGRAWEVIVEPDEHRRLLVVVTAYPMGG